MIATIATALGVSTRVAKLLSYALTILAIGGALYGAYCWAWDQGRDHERNRWEQAAKKAREKRQEQADQAETQDVETRTQTTTAIDERRKELEDATAKIPDQGLSDRQRARAAAELRRQQGR